MAHYDLTLSGGITGTMWWPQAEGAISFRLDLSREIGRFTEKPTLREALLHVLMEKGGDFQNSVFTADTCLTITARKPDRMKSRTWEITSFPSIADMVNAEVYHSDFTWND